MKKRKIKINPGQKDTPKIKIKGLGEEENKIRIKQKDSPSDPEIYISPFQRYQKVIIIGGITLMVLCLGFAGWWAASDSPSTELVEIQEKVSTKPLNILDGDSLIQSQQLDGDVQIRKWLTGFKVSEDQVSILENRFRLWVNDGVLRSGHFLQVWGKKSNINQITKVRYEINSYNYLVWGIGDSLYMDVEKTPTDTRLKVVHEIIKDDFKSSLDANNIGLRILEDLERELAWKVDFFHLERGDAYSLMFEEHYADNKFVETGMLKAAWFRTQGKEHFCYLFTQTKKPGYYDDTARPVKSSFLRSPLKYSRISSHFGIRTHPIDKAQKQHRGTDYVASEGTEIHAVAEGEITAARFHPLNGNFVRINHGQGFETIYLHLKSFGNGIRKGVKITQDQVIGNVGSTGKSTGPHLCFNLKKNGKFLDYLKADLPSAEPMPDVEATEFFVLRDSLNKILHP